MRYVYFLSGDRHDISTAVPPIGVTFCTMVELTDHVSLTCRVFSAFGFDMKILNAELWLDHCWPLRQTWHSDLLPFD